MSARLRCEILCHACNYSPQILFLYTHCLEVLMLTKTTNKFFYEGFSTDRSGTQVLCGFHALPLAHSSKAI